jgi:hypothetical protein
MGYKKETVPVITVTDDKDGADLDPDTKPVPLSFKGKSYDLYLSPANVKELEKVLGEYTKHATPKGTRGRTATVKRELETYGLTAAQVREHAVPAGLAKSAGRLSQAAYDYAAKETGKA